MLHVFILVAVLFQNPTTGDEQMGRAIAASPSECASMINETPHTVDTDSGTYYMVASECHGGYADADDNVVTFDGSAQ